VSGGFIVNAGSPLVQFEVLRAGKIEPAYAADKAAKVCPLIVVINKESRVPCICGDGYCYEVVPEDARSVRKLAGVRGQRRTTMTCTCSGRFVE
jgi:hypothetical protein